MFSGIRTLTCSTWTWKKYKTILTPFDSALIGWIPEHVEIHRCVNEVDNQCQSSYVFLEVHILNARRRGGEFLTVLSSVRALKS